MQKIWIGTALLVVSSVAFSAAGFFTRLVPLDVWTVLFWRGIFGGVFIAAFFVMERGLGTIEAVRSIGRPGLAVAALSTVATIAFIHALRIGSVADVMVIAATLPFVTALLAWAWFGERERWTTLAASIAAFAGIALMFGWSTAPRSLGGDALAFVMPLAIGAMMVIIRQYRATSMLPAVALSAFLCSLAVLPFATPSAAHGINLVYLGLFGTLQFGLGLLTLTLGTRFVSATRAALIANIETPLGIALVWASFDEVPAAITIVGGTIVLAAVVADILMRNPVRDVSARDEP